MRRRLLVLVAVALVVGFVPGAAVAQDVEFGEPAEAGSPKGASSAGAEGCRRSFYLTVDEFDGSAPLTACAPGYHFASFWEIVEGMDYDTSLGFTQIDSGPGPPVFVNGWLRGVNDLSSTVGIIPKSCVLGSLPWSTDSTALEGGVGWIWPLGGRGGGAGSGLEILFQECNIETRVWCVED